MDFYVNADPHGDFSKIADFCNKMQLTNKDTIILLGDVAVNYYGNIKDEIRKQILNELGPKFFCIHGNHEQRPEHIKSYELVDFNGGKIWIDKNYPNICFAKDGEIFDFDGKKCIVLGGAYSVDKGIRLLRGWQWFEDEQPSDEIKSFAVKNLERNNWRVDYVFSHTCPYRYEPRECFLPGIDQRKVDKTTEMWLDEIYEKLDFDKWFIGHFHIDKSIDKMQFLFNSFAPLKTKESEHDFSVFDNLES